MPAPSQEKPITSFMDPDLGAVERFISDMIAHGAIAALIAAIVALLVKMRDLNTELVRKLTTHSRKRPPSETMRRLQMELPLLFMKSNRGPGTNTSRYARTREQAISGR